METKNHKNHTRAQFMHKNEKKSQSRRRKGGSERANAPLPHRHSQTKTRKKGKKRA